MRSAGYPPQNQNMEQNYNSKEIINSLIGEVEKVVIGKKKEIRLLITAMLAGGHVLIEDVPGTGKTTLASALSKACGLEFNRAQFTPDVMASDITGFNIYNRSKETFEFRHGLVMANVLLADEINRASPKTQSALLEAMEEKKVTVDGTTYPLPDPFMVIATQNPSGYVGTYPLPEAQLDRFCMKLSMGYPNESEEMNIIMQRKETNPLLSVNAVATPEIIKAMMAEAQAVKVSGEICRYIVQLVAATRQSKSISLGASPRATLALMKLAQAYALIDGRDYVVAEDIAALFAFCISHRIVLSQDARLNRVSASDAVAEVFKSIEVPYRTGR